MDDLCYENDFSNNSSDEYEREQLEIALYSQIHFEENDEENYNNSSSDFIIDVQGNDKKGIAFDKTNANIILTAEIDKKYKSSSDEKITLNKDKKYMKNKTLNNVTIKSSKPESAPSSARKQEKVTLVVDTASKEVNQAEKIQALLRDGPCFAKKTVSTGKVILGSESDNGSADDNSDKEEVMLNAGSEDDDEDSDNDEVVLSNSDSDLDSLDIVLEQSDTEAADLKMNVYSNPRYTYKKMSHDDSGVCNEAEDSDDSCHWAISREDSFKDIGASPSGHGRYYRPIRCHNCNYVGHLSKNCPKPKKVIVCAQCSEPGHISRNCPQGMCYNCEEPGHESRTCTAPRRNLNSVCHRCKMEGHRQSDCPDTWRQYHVTVTPGRLQEFSGKKKRKRPSCYNCGDEGHFGHECEEERMNKFLRVSTPFVCRYNTASQLNDMVRLYEETEDRPLKRTRSEDWTGNRDYSKTYRDRRNKTPDIERNTNKQKARESPTGNTTRKPSPFAHFLKKHPESRTGRSNFDRLQFTIQNKKKQADVKHLENVESPEKFGKKKSKRKKKKKDKNESQSSSQDYMVNELQQSSSRNLNRKNKRDVSKESQHYLTKGSCKRKVTASSSDMSVTIQTNRDFNDVFETTGSDKVIENNSLKKTLSFEQKKPTKQVMKSSRSCCRLDQIDFTVKTETAAAREQESKSGKILKKYASDRNDSMRPDDLFSLQTIKKVQSGQSMNSLLVTEDVEHRIDNKASQNKNKRKHRQKNKHIYFY